MHDQECWKPCDRCQREDWQCPYLDIACYARTPNEPHLCPECETLSPTRAVCNPHRTVAQLPTTGTLGCLDVVTTIRLVNPVVPNLLGNE